MEMCAAALRRTFGAEVFAERIQYIVARAPSEWKTLTDALAATCLDTAGCAFTSQHLCVHIKTCIDTYIYTHIYLYIHIFHIHKYIYKYVCVYTYIQKYIYIFIHAHI